MKPDIHPPYRPVLFVDATTGASFVTGSTVTTKSTATGPDGRTYPVKRVDVTADSHPFWTGTQRVIDPAGRIERFRRKYGQ